MPSPSFARSDGKQFVRSDARQRLSLVAGLDDIQWGVLQASEYRPTVSEYLGTPPTQTQPTPTNTQAALNAVEAMNFPPLADWPDWAAGDKIVFQKIAFPLGYFPPFFDDQSWIDQQQELQQNYSLYPSHAGGPFPGGAAAGWYFGGNPGFYGIWNLEIQGREVLGTIPNWINSVTWGRVMFRTKRPHTGTLMQAQIWQSAPFPDDPDPDHHILRKVQSLGTVPIGANQLYEVPLPGGGYQGPVARSKLNGPGTQYDTISYNCFHGMISFVILDETAVQWSQRTGIALG